MKTKTPPQWPTGATAVPKQKKIHYFLWIFLTVQVLFVVWIIGGAGAASGEECIGLTGAECADAKAAGTAIGIAVIIFFWAAVDIILGVIYGIYRLARNR